MLRSGLIVAPCTGIADINAAFEGRNTEATTTDVHVPRNSSPLFSAGINGFDTPNRKQFTTNISVVGGDTLAFAVGYGANGDNSRGDTSSGWRSATRSGPATRPRDNSRDWTSPFQKGTQAARSASFGIFSSVVWCRGMDGHYAHIAGRTPSNGTAGFQPAPRRVIEDLSPSAYSASAGPEIRIWRIAGVRPARPNRQLKPTLINNECLRSVFRHRHLRSGLVYARPHQRRPRPRQGSQRPELVVGFAAPRTHGHLPDRGLGAGPPRCRRVAVWSSTPAARSSGWQRQAHQA